MKPKAWGALAGAIVVSMGTVSAAEAAYPGQNGKIVYEHKADQFASKRSVFTVSAGDPASARKLVRFKETTLNFVYSPNGKKIAFQAEVPDSQIFVMKARGKKPKSVTKKVDDCIGHSRPTWSPDGTKIAFQCLNSTGFNQHDIWSVNANGSGLNQVTDTHDAYWPAWSPLGDRIAFSTYGGAIYTVPAGGGASTVLNGDAPGISGIWNKIDWAPNGLTLVSESSGDGIRTIDATTGAASPLLAQAGGEPVFSPDGTKILYVGFGEVAPSSELHLWMMDPNGQNQQQVTSAGYARAPNWGPAP